jgi:hypothetical protein
MNPQPISNGFYSGVRPDTGVGLPALIGQGGALIHANAYQLALLPVIPNLAAVAVAMPTAGYSSLVTGTAQAGGKTTPASGIMGQVPAHGTITLAAGASATDSAYVGKAIRITTGTGAGARGTITAYVGATKVATVNWGTGASGAAGVPAALDNTSVYELSIDCFNCSKIIIKVEYGNSTCTAALRVGIRDQNGKVCVAAKQTPVNLGISDQATTGFLAEGFEVATDGMDTAYVFVDTAASGGSSPSVSAWAVGA